MEPYKKPELTADELAQVAALEDEFERYGKEHPEWERLSLGRRDQTRPAWQEYVRRLEAANYIVSKGRGTGDNIDVKKPG
jgi:hypothetical protein